MLSPAVRRLRVVTFLAAREAPAQDERTWGQPGFADLIERGIRWATRTDDASLFERPKLIGPDPAAKPFDYVTAEGVPFYEPDARGRRGGGVWNQMPKPLTPDESKRHMVSPEGRPRSSSSMPPANATSSRAKTSAR